MPTSLSRMRGWFAAALALSLVAARESGSPALAQCLTDSFDWDGVTPSPTFNWVPCYNGFQCAKFETPLDYTNPEGAKAHIATAKWPSKYPANDTRYRGAIWSNPGGPGISGVGFMVAAAPLFVELIGDDYDYISFDPRGVQRTTPAPVVYKSDAERRAWEARDFNAMEYTIDGIGRTLARAEVLGRLALERDDGSAAHIGTADVARDIVAMNAALGLDKVQYWGGSYGTILGVTLAAMYPDKIERMVLDSVMEAGTYYDATWTDNFLHTDEDLAWFFTSCSASSACALHEATPDGVRARYDAIVASVQAKPVPVVDGDVYGIVDWALLHNALFPCLYEPYDLWGPMADALAGLERGNGTLAYAMGSSADASTWTCECDKKPPALQPSDLLSTLAIRCGDAAPVDDTLDELKEWYAKQLELTDFAETQPTRPWCAGWMIQVKNKFNGPLAANTSHPILLMANTVDPATPIESAHETAERFPGSVVLAVEAPGHGVLTTPSVCMIKYLRDYYREGTLPPTDTLCKTDRPIFPFDEESRSNSKRSTVSADDERLLDAVERLRRGVHLGRIL